MNLYSDSPSHTDWFSRLQSHLLIHPVTFADCLDSPCRTLAGCPNSRCCTLDCYPESHRHTWLVTWFPQSVYLDSCRHTFHGCANSHLKLSLFPHSHWLIDVVTLTQLYLYPHLKVTLYFSIITLAGYLGFISHPCLQLWFTLIHLRATMNIGIITIFFFFFCW